jgi:hypothetical protein
MAKDLRTFTKGKMNKELDERLVPDGEYTDALNIRVGSTEEDEMGVIETTLGNTQLTTLQVQNTPLSTTARCIGALEDGSTETIYWFVHDPAFSASSNTGKLDLIVSFNTSTQVTTYHVISMDDGGGVKTTLNFSPTYLITGVSLIDDLLFFTDDYNPPRRINVTRTYGEPTSADVDTITPDELLVIKKAPVTSPLVNSSFNSNISSTFMEERFICFAYRWRYDDNEYSATSQFSTPVFTPKSFDFTPKSYLNEGFINKHNNATITYNTGSSLVKGIDILFKEANDSTIKVIEKLDKAKLGLPDNNDLTFNFSDSKIFTILPNSEILRLYDNVPLLAQAQTLMGNRLMYGNYLEGYDLVDSSGNPTQLNYICTLKENTLSQEDLPSGNIQGASTTYTLPQSVTGGAAQTVTDGRQQIDLTPFCVDGQGNSRLTAGSVMEFEFQIYVESGSPQEVGPGPFPAQVPPGTSGSPQTITATFTLNANYNTLADWMGSANFQNQVGTLTNILPVYDSGGASTSCDGGTLTDSYNCGREQQLGSFTLVTTGITSATTIAQPEPVSFSQTSGNTCEVIFPGLRYTDNPASPASDSFFFYRFDTTATKVTFFPAGTAESLHSNRGYEVGIMYMDEYNRSTTALVSNNNAVHVPCSASDTKNQIRVEIPTSQKPPAWATRYKFGIKPDEAGYNTIYSNTFFVDSTQNRAYILLQGENPRKVEEGDRLIVKADTSGPVNECLYVTVLEKKVMQANELPGNDGVTGTYMVISTDGLALNASPGSLKDTGMIEAKAEDFFNIGTDRAPYILLPLNTPMGNPSGGDSGPGADYPVPAGSIVTIKLQGDRIGTGNVCEERRIDIDDLQFTVTQNYSSLSDWFVGDDIITTLINEDFYTGGGGVGLVKNAGSASPSSPNDPSTISGSGSANFDTGNGKDDMRVPNDLNTIGIPSGLAQSEFGACVLTYPSGRKYLGFRGTICCGSNNNKTSRLKGRIRVRLALDLLVFETLPADAQPDIFFESSVSYPITNGFHEGNVQDQTSTQSAIVDTAFYNCYTYGNGVESYKVRDSIVGKDFNLGNRVTATQGQDYKQVRRYADITYSGVYNQESNVNKSNEFNLGLLNFKPLEQRFGYIRKMAGRETDVLVLQEDKISYVLAGKNLLSDAVGGGDVTSIPEVLGTQIARTEEYGISDNPESYAEYGYDKFFTDAKRGVVIQLRGSGAQNEQLNVISDQGMSTWFRELFQVSFDKQKLGAYDPYAGEYVLSSNLKNLPSEKKELPCGTSQTFNVDSGINSAATYDLGTTTGDVVITYQFVGTGNFANLRFQYDGVSYAAGPQSSPAIGTVTVPKPNPTPTTGILTVGGTGSNGTVLITVKCPDAETLNVIQVCLTSASDAGELIHNEFSFGQGTYTSPTSSTQVTFSNSGIAPVVSQYDIFTGLKGSGFIPSGGSTVTMAGNRFGSDTYVTQPGTQFSYLKTNVSYANTQAGINSLLAAIASPPAGFGGLVSTSGVGSPYTFGSFTNTASSTRDNLYLVYDYRQASGATSLCYDSSKPQLACCCRTSVNVYLDAPTLSGATAIYSDAALTTPAADGYYAETNSQGLSIYRLQTTSGSTTTLSPASVCAACSPGCGTTVRGSSPKDDYAVWNCDMGSGTGAIVINFPAPTIPLGIRATYDGTVTNLLSAGVVGQRGPAPAGDFVVVGETASSCPQLPGTFNLNNLVPNSGTWVTAGGSTSITHQVSSLFINPNLGEMVMVIHKPNATPSNLKLELTAPCGGGTVLDVSVACAQTLPATPIGRNATDAADACSASTIVGNAYFVHTDGTVGGAPQFGSFAFNDAAASAPLAQGWYYYNDGTPSGGRFNVVNGIAYSVATCP